MSRPKERLPMRRPLLSLTIAFILGIWLQDLVEGPVWWAWILCAVFSVGAAILALVRLGGVLRIFLWVPAFLFLGVARGELPAVNPVPESWQSMKMVVSGIARSGWLPQKDRRQLILDVASVGRPGEKESAVKARMRVTVLQQEVSPDCPQVLPGDRVWALSSVHKPFAVHNPSGLDYRRLMQRRGIEWTGTVNSCREISVESSSESWFRGGIEKMRADLFALVMNRDAKLPEKSLLLALTIGEQGLIPDSTQLDFQRTGLTHLLSISGLHLGFVAFGLYALLLKILVRIPRLSLRWDVRRIASALVIPAVVFYAGLSGANLPVIRSAIMVGCFLLAVLLRRESDPMQILCVAVLATLGIWPQSLFEISFQLSFVAVAAIILVFPVVTQWIHLPWNRSNSGDSLLRRLFVRVVHFLIVSLAATLGTAPLVAYHFNQVSLVSLLANFLAVPLTTWLIVPLGLVGVVLFPFQETLAGGVMDGALTLCDCLGRLTHGIAEFSGSAVSVARPSLFSIVIWYAMLGAILRLPNRWARRTVIGGLVLVLGVWGITTLVGKLSSRLEVTMIDVGQGDSTWIRFPDGKTMLVDAGRGQQDGAFDMGRMVVAPFLWGQGITRLDIVALTHPEEDHIGGLPAVVRLFRPREIWAAHPLSEHPLALPLLQAADEVGARVRILHAEQSPLVGDGYETSVLWPREDATGLTLNESSLVLKVRQGRRTILLMGDLEAAGERGLCDTFISLHADVLKVGHHGSGNATSLELLQRVRPAFAWISVGAKNPFRLPHPDTLLRLQAANIPIYRTDQRGAISLTTDGTDLDLDSQLGLETE